MLVVSVVSVVISRISRISRIGRVGHVGRIVLVVLVMSVSCSGRKYSHQPVVYQNMQVEIDAENGWR
jgi:hypothetical protein